MVPLVACKGVVALAVSGDWLSSVAPVVSCADVDPGVPWSLAAVDDDSTADTAAVVVVTAADVGGGVDDVKSLDDDVGVETDDAAGGFIDEAVPVVEITANNESFQRFTGCFSRGVKAKKTSA